MIGHPKYNYGDIVTYKLEGEFVTGTVEIIDAYGTFFQHDEPSYDILVTDGKWPGLHKHVEESCIVEEK